MFGLSLRGTGRMGVAFARGFGRGVARGGVTGEWGCCTTLCSGSWILLITTTFGALLRQSKMTTPTPVMDKENVSKKQIGSIFYMP